MSKTAQHGGLGDDSPTDRHDGMSNGLRIIVVATVVAGIAGYAITWFVYREIGPSQYAQFAVFWSALYLLIGSFSGIQQEITRASSRRMSASDKRGSQLFKFGVGATLAVSLIVLLLATFISDQVFGAAHRGFIVPLAIGVGAYVVTAVISGALYGLSQWRILGTLMAMDALLRLIFVGFGALWGATTEVLAWLVVAPFILTPLFIFLWLRKALKDTVQLDARYGVLAGNTTATIGAAFFTAMVISGFPMVLGFFAGESEPGLLGEVIYVVTLTRAPLVVAVSALQSLLVIRFKSENNSGIKNVLLVQLLVLCATVFLGLAVSWFGVGLFELITGGPMAVDASFMIAVVISSGLLAVMTVFGAALLARGRHIVYVIGWFTAAVATIVSLGFADDLITRVTLALIFAPAVGVVVQVLFLFLPTKSSRTLPID